MHFLLPFVIGSVIGWIIVEATMKDVRPVSNFVRRAWDRWSIKQQMTYVSYQLQQKERRQAYFDQHGI